MQGPITWSMPVFFQNVLWSLLKCTSKLSYGVKESISPHLHLGQRWTPQN